MKVLARSLLVVIMLFCTVAAVFSMINEMADIGFRWLGILALALVFWVIIELLARIAEELEASRELLRLILSKTHQQQ